MATWAAQGGQRGRISYFENSFCRSRGVGTTRKVEFTPLRFILHVSGVECAKTAGFLDILYTIPLPIDPTLTAQGGITTPLSTTFLVTETIYINKNQHFGHIGRPLWLQTLQFSSVVRFTMIKSAASQPSSLTACQHHSLTALQPHHLPASHL